MKQFIFIAAIFFVPLNDIAQNVGIGTTTPDASAQLEITSSAKGLLVPRMTRAQRTAISNPAKSLLVYQTDLDSGFYYNARSAASPNWLSLQSQLTGWGTKGNSGTNPYVYFIGTTDEQSLQFRINNFKAGILDSANFNTGFGYRTLDADFGTSSAAFGYKALTSNTVGVHNTASGGNALRYNTTGWNNAGFGYQTLLSNTTGSNNTGVGYFADVSSPELSNATAIGANARVDCSNCMVLGSVNGINGGSSNVNVGIGVTNPQQILSVAGGMNIDQDNANNGGLDNNVLRFGVSNSGEAIGSDRTGGGNNQYGLDFYTASTKRMVIASNGNVGIGINDVPAFKLDIGDRVRIRSGGGFSTAGLYFNKSDNSQVAGFIGMDDDTHVGFWGSGVGWRFSMNTQSGALKINGSEGNAGQVLSSNGSASAPSWVNPSLSALYNNMTEYAQTSVVTMYNPGPGTAYPIPGLTGISLVINSVSKVIFSAGILVDRDPCGGCGSVANYLSVELTVYPFYMAGDQKYISPLERINLNTGMQFHTLNPGTYTINVKIFDGATGSGTASDGWLNLIVIPQ